jgi:Ni,Fe-hydrogenase III large subunit
MTVPLKESLRDCPRVDMHRPWPRVAADEEIWLSLAVRLREGDITLSGLWGDTGAVHMAILDETSAELVVVSLECPQRNFPSVGQIHPPAIRLERAIQDIFGLTAKGSPDARNWLDHGRWGVRHPLGDRTEPVPPAAYAFLPSDGEGLHQIPVGPVHAGIIEPGHFRFTANGETVVRLEERLGYVHKGIESLMQGAELMHAAKLAGRTSGDSTLAYAVGFARAAEAALDIEAPARAHWLRGLMAELERLANHLGDFGAVCNDASFSLIYAHCGVLRERVLRASRACFGHRLMRDCVVPGGTSVDLDERSIATLHALLKDVRQQFPEIVSTYDNTASLQDRTVATGVLAPALARQFGAGGYVGRASGRAFDARRVFAYPPYDQLDFAVPILGEGDVNARVWIRIREVEQSLSLVEQILARIPDGPIRTDLPARAGEGISLVEGFRGDILVWLRLDDRARVSRCHLRDPSWFQWPLLEAAIEGNIVADFPLCNKSFNCSYSGHDL